MSKTEGENMGHESKGIPADALKMYEIPGQENISEDGRGYARYLHDKENEDPKIIGIANNPSKSIEQALASGDVGSQKVVAGIIQHLPQESREVLILKLADAIETALGSGDVEAQKIGAEMIQYLPRELKAPLVEKALGSGDVEAQNVVAGMIWHLPEKLQAPFIHKLAGAIGAALASEDALVQKVGAGMIWCLPLEQQPPFIEQSLASRDVRVQKVGAGMIWGLSHKTQDSFAPKVLAAIDAALASGDVEVQRAGAEMIWCLPQELQAPFVEKALESGDVGVQRAGAETIRYLPQGLRAPFIEKLVGVMNTAFASGDVEVQRAGAEMVWHLPHELREKMLAEIDRKGLMDVLISHPLYDSDDVDVQEERFSRHNFEKTGSETTLLGGELKDKTIIRKITPKAFVAWQKAFEAYTEWESADFDYVPVEPIQSFKLRKDGLVDVYSGILDLSLSTWNQLSSRYSQELDSESEKIEKVLVKLGINHGHSHARNFVLRFYRDAAGRVDIFRKPRIYIIDFDQAVSPDPQNIG